MLTKDKLERLKYLIGKYRYTKGLSADEISELRGILDEAYLALHSKHKYKSLGEMIDRAELVIGFNVFIDKAVKSLFRDD